ncbi:MAG: TonB-dependent receptor [Chitinophagaceae bacterium]
MKRIYLLIAFAFCSTAVFPQQILKGIYFINAETKVPVQDLSVISSDNKFSASTDESGFVGLPKMYKQDLNLTISGIGFETQTIVLSSLILTKENAIVYMSPKVSTLSDVVVRASSNKGIFKTISDLDIHLRPIVNSQEVLRIVPGLFIGQHAGGGKAEQIFIRGFDIDHGTDINISVDGLPVNMVSHAHGQGYADLHFVIPELIEKVNFNKGPYFANTGNLATAGYVSFKTKNFLDNNFAKIEGGQFGTFRGIAGINLLKTKKDIRDKSLYIASEFSFTKGYFESPQNFNRINSFVKYHGKISHNSSVTAMVSAFSSKWNASGQIPDRAVADGSIGFFGAIDNKEGGLTGRYNANAELTTNLNNGGVIRNQLFFSKYIFELYSNFTFFKEDPVNGDQIRQKEERSIAGYNGSYTQNHVWGNIKTQTNTGVQIRFDRISNLELSRTKDRSIVTKSLMLGNVNELNAGFFVSEKFILNNNFEITAGLRGDYFSNHYTDKLAGNSIGSSSSFIVSPKLNFNYRINDKVQVYWYNGQGFHSNDTRVAVAQNGREVVTPAWGSDLGGIIKLSNKAVIQTALWYLWMKQEFVFVGDEGVVEPGGKTQRIGWDMSLRYEVVKNLYADADITVANPRALEVPSAESYLPLAPRFTSSGGITYRKASGWNGSIRYRFMDKRPANEDYSVTAKGYFITDAAINYTQKKWEAGIAVQNIFNRKWKETQFDTESRLQGEPAPVSEIHFTPGTPLFARLSFTLFI